MRLLHFAWVREAVGTDEEEIVLPPGIVTVADLAKWLAERHPVFADTSKLRVAVDQQMAGWDSPIAGANEVAFFPPVTGG